MYFEKTSNHLRRVVVGCVALSLAATMVMSCKKDSDSDIKVAGGTIDGSGSSAKYPGTVYVELNGRGFNDKASVIRNVGTLVDIGLPSSYALILSLSDALYDQGGRSILPLFKTGSLKLYLSNGEDAITLPGMGFQKDGILRDSQGRSYLTLAVGVRVEKLRNTEVPENKIRDITNKLFIESPLVAGGGKNLRVPATSYMLIAVPKNSHPALASIAIPKLIVAEDRSIDQDGLVVAGFGENIAGSEKSKDFSLAAALPSVMKRNYADVKVVSGPTPMKELMAGNAALSRELWEIEGSGLCGSKDGSNYDTGATVYQGSNMVGFAVVSSTKSSGFKGKLDCASTSRDDMVTLVVSPSRTAIEMFKSRVR